MENDMTKDERKKANSATWVTVVDGKLVFNFDGLAPFTFDPDRVSAQNRARAMMHGFEQRIRDAGALGRDRETGASATPEQKRESMWRIAEHLMSGGTEWALKVAAPRSDDPGLLMASIMRALNRDAAGVEAVIAATMSKRGIDRTAALKVWQDTDKVKAAKAAILAERAAAAAARADVDADDLLAEIEGPDEGGEDEAPM